FPQRSSAGILMAGERSRSTIGLQQHRPIRRPRRKEQEMRKVFELGGVIAATVLIAFGIAAIVMGVNGHSTVNDTLKQELIVGSPDMTPAGITAEAKKAGLDVSALSIPNTSVANMKITNGDRARSVAGYMRTQAL